MAKDKTAAEQQTPPPAPHARAADAATPPVIPPDPRDEKIAALERANAEMRGRIDRLMDAIEDGAIDPVTAARLEKLESLVSANAVNAAGVVQDEKSRKEQEAIKAEIDKGTARRTQEAADRTFPGGKHRFVCKLVDGNGHPELVIGAETETDAAARYCAVCGIRSSEKQVSVQRA